MPELTDRAVHEFWKGYQDPMIYRVISFMEAVENWTVDNDPDVKEALRDLGESLEGVAKFELVNEELYIKSSCHLKTGKILRLLQAIDTIHPGSASRVLMYAEENNQGHDSPAGLFLRRNIVFERLRLLTRVFSPERFAIVSKAMESEDE
jgi:intracellular multiplication protein IcmW